MTPKISRGHSFKGLSGYLEHGGESVEADAPQQQREGFTKLYNFAPGEAKNIKQAAKVMALTVRDADLLKQEAGIKPGGAKPKGGPVYHLTLPWHPSENPSQEEKLQAVEQCLAAVGLGIEKGYQTYVREHRDTPHPHVHVVVNLVHPITGKQANPYRDQKRAQEWGHAYDKARGNNFCPERTKKHEDRENWIAKGKPRRPVQDFDRAARGAAIKPAVARLKADTAKRYADLKTTEKAERDHRRAEFRQLVKERRAGREAIYGQYAPKLNAVWSAKPQQGPRLSPDRGALPAAVIRHNERRADFEHQEGSFLGRLRNASSLVGARASMFSKLRLALDADRRRSLFETRERALLQAAMPPRPAPDSPRPATPVPKTLQAARLKEARQAELSAYDAQTRTLTKAMEQRHGTAQKAAAARRDATGKEVAAAWQQLRTTYRLTPQPAKAFTRAAEPPKIPVTARFQQAWDAPYKITQAGPPAQIPSARPAQTPSAPLTKAADPRQETRSAATPTPPRRDGPDFKQVFKAASQQPAPPPSAAPEFTKAAERVVMAPTRPAVDEYRALLSQPAAPRQALPAPSANNPAAPAKPAGDATPPATSKPTPPPPEIEQAPQRKADQFGRSRDRAPRAPRDPARREQQKVAREAARAGKSTQDAVQADQMQETAAMPPPAQQPPVAQQWVKANDNLKSDKRGWTADDIARLNALNAYRDAEVAEAENEAEHDHGGREMSP